MLSNIGIGFTVLVIILSFLIIYTAMLDLETSSQFIKKNIYKLSFYKEMMRKINVKKIKLFDKLLELVSKGHVISGIGAGAKSNTFLTYYGLDNNIINFLTDASKFKQKKYTPVTRIVIKDDNELIKYSKIACIILSWNISNLVIDKIKKLNKKIKIIYT